MVVILMHFLRKYVKYVSNYFSMQYSLLQHGVSPFIIFIVKRYVCVKPMKYYFSLYKYRSKLCDS